MAILDFVFDQDKHEPDKYRYDVKLTDIDTQRVFYDKLTFIYLEMPKFNKRLDELKTRFEKWLFVLRNLSRLDRIPDTLREKVFEQLFAVAEIARFTPEQRQSYEDSLKYYRDLKNSLDTAFEEGLIEGIAKGEEIGAHKNAIAIARNLLDVISDNEVLAVKTGLSVEQIRQLREQRQAN